MQTRYVNTASSAGGDGTTNNTSGSTRAYASLSEWEAARQAVLSEVEECICEGATADSTGVTIDGWTTDASNYILIRTTQANRHSGKWDTSKYRLDASRAYYAVLEVYERYVRVEGIQARNTNNATWSTRGIAFMPDGNGNVSAANAEYRADACIAYGCGSGADGMYAYGGTARFTNCISVGNSGDGFRSRDGGSGGTHTFYNCAAVGNTGAGFHPIHSGINITVRNCYAGGNTGSDYSTADTTFDTLNYSYSEDGSASTSTAAYSTSSGCYFTNVTAGSEDLAIANASSTLVDAGVDLSGTFTTDILGATRSGTWEVGPFNYAAAGGAISGSAALTFGTGSSALTGTGALAGTSALVFDDGSSVLTAMGALAGSSALVFAGSATAGAPGVLAGSAALVFANSATLVGGGALAGSAAMVTGAGSSTLTGAGALAGASALVFGAGSTVLTGTGALAGVSAVVFSASLQAEGSIAGSVALVFGAGASTLTALGALAGNASLTLDGAGTLSRIVDTVLTGPTRITHGEGWTRFEAGERVTLIAFSQPATRVH